MKKIGKMVVMTSEEFDKMMKEREVLINNNINKTRAIKALKNENTNLKLSNNVREINFDNFIDNLNC